MRLNQSGLIYGESAPCGGLNVSRRLQLLDQIHAFGGHIALDLGCGKGSYTGEFAKWYDTTVAIDVLLENLSIARERLSSSKFEDMHFFCAKGELIPLNSESVDAVFMIEVLDHVPTLHPCLNEVFRVLKPGGIFYVTVPNRAFLFETHPVRFLGKYMKPFWFPFLPWCRYLHGRLATARVFSKKDLRKLVESVGLKLVDMVVAYPPLEHRGGPELRSVMRWLETTHLRDLGSILAAAFCKST